MAYASRFRPAPQPGTRGELYSKAAGEPGWEPLDRYEQRPHALSERRLPHIHHARRLVQRRRIGVVRGPRRQLVGWNRLRNGKVRVFQAADGLPDDSVKAILEDRAGVLWVATGGGLARLDGDR